MPASARALKIIDAVVYILVELRIRVGAQEGLERGVYEGRHKWTIGLVAAADHAVMWGGL